MPKRVDHSAKRMEILEAARRTVAGRGLEGATVRAISKEAGYSTGVLTRYFKNKEDVIEGATEAAFRREVAEMRSAARGLHGLEALRAIHHSDQPVTDEHRGDSRTWLRFVVEGMVHERLAQRFRDHYRYWRRVTRKELLAGIAAGEFAADIDVALEVDRLIALSDGLLIQVLFEPKRWPVSRFRAAIDAQLAAIPPPATHPRTHAPERAER